MKYAKWKTIKLLNGYVLLADGPTEHVQKRVHKELERLRADVEKQVAANREDFIVGSTPIRNADGLLGWIILAARAGMYEKRVNNLLWGLAE